MFKHNYKLHVAIHAIIHYNNTNFMYMYIDAHNIIFFNLMCNHPILLQTIKESMIYSTNSEVLYTRVSGILI